MPDRPTFLPDSIAITPETLGVVARTTPDQWDVASGYVLQGESAKAIAKRRGTSKWTVHALLNTIRCRCNEVVPAEQESRDIREWRARWYEVFARHAQNREAL